MCTVPRPENAPNKGVRRYGPLEPRTDRLSVDFLILGHPRSGTGYMAKLLTSAGYEVGHEFIGAHGISCWTFTTPNANHLYGTKNSIRYRSRQDLDYRHLIHNVREPSTALGSIFFSENGERSMSARFRRMHCNLIDPQHSGLDQVVESYVGWNEMIASLDPHLTVKVEDCEDEVGGFLLSEGYAFTGFEDPPSKNYNQRPAWKQNNPDGLTDEMLNGLLPANKARLIAFCERYGYDPIIR